jgi:hypothetical protein
MWYFKNMKFGKNKLTVQTSGDLLVAEFQTALNNLVTMDSAEAEAQYSEANIENALKYQAPKNGVFLTPQDISPEAADALVRNSIDAHLKKVQAQQIKAYASSQVGQQQQEAEQNYKGRKVKITAITNDKDIFIPLWADKRMSQLREGTFKGKTIAGTIDDLALDKNLLVIKPTWVWRSVQPDRRFFLVVVINMQTLMPNVEIKLL